MQLPLNAVGFGFTELVNSVVIRQSILESKQDFLFFRVTFIFFLQAVIIPCGHENALLSCKLPNIPSGITNAAQRGNLFSDIPLLSLYFSD